MCQSNDDFYSGYSNCPHATFWRRKDRSEREGIRKATRMGLCCEDGSLARWLASCKPAIWAQLNHARASLSCKVGLPSLILGHFHIWSFTINNVTLMAQSRVVGKPSRPLTTLFLLSRWFAPQYDWWPTTLILNNRHICLSFGVLHAALTYRCQLVSSAYQITVSDQNRQVEEQP